MSQFFLISQYPSVTRRVSDFDDVLTFRFLSSFAAMLCAFAFAEKFYDADIKKIVYGQVKWIKDLPVEPQLFEITSLHYLNSLTYNMQPDTKEEAMKALKLFFSL